MGRGELSGLVAGDSAICGRLAALILRLRPAGLRFEEFRSPVKRGGLGLRYCIHHSFCFGQGEVRVYKGTGVSRGVRRTTWERSLKNWELQTPCFEEFFLGREHFGTRPCQSPSRFGIRLHFLRPHFPSPNCCSVFFGGFFFLGGGNSLGRGELFTYSWSFFAYS